MSNNFNFSKVNKKVNIATLSIEKKMLTTGFLSDYLSANQRLK